MAVDIDVLTVTMEYRIDCDVRGRHVITHDLQSTNIDTQLKKKIAKP